MIAFLVFSVVCVFALAVWLITHRILRLRKNLSAMMADAPMRPELAGKVEELLRWAEPDLSHPLASICFDLKSRYDRDLWTLLGGYRGLWRVFCRAGRLERLCAAAWEWYSGVFEEAYDDSSASFWVRLYALLCLFESLAYSPFSVPYTPPRMMLLAVIELYYGRLVWGASRSKGYFDRRDYGDGLGLVA